MTKKEIELGTEVWNIADGFTKTKILRQLIQLDRYDTLAQFGTDEMDEANLFDDNALAMRRVNSLRRFFSTLKQLMGNVKFALRKKDNEEIGILYVRLMTVEEFLKLCYETYENEVTHENKVEINELLFGKCLQVLQSIKDDLNFPINKANLIFRQSEEMDLDAMMKEIEEGG